MPLQAPKLPRRGVSKRKTSKAPSRSKLIKLADKLTSIYVRLSYADKNGMVKCYTCPYIAHWRKMQNGHYITRSLKTVRWDLGNCRPQCFVCNMRNQGMSHLFRENLCRDTGEGSVKGIEIASKILFKEDDSFIQELINRLTPVVHNLLAEHNEVLK